MDGIYFKVRPRVQSSARSWTRRFVMDLSSAMDMFAVSTLSVVLIGLMSPLRTKLVSHNVFFARVTLSDDA